MQTITQIKVNRYRLIIYHLGDAKRRNLLPDSERASREFLFRGRHVGSIDRQISGRSAISSRRYVDGTSSRYQPDDLCVVDPLHGRQSGGSRERYVPDATAIVRSSGYSIVDIATRRFAVTRRLPTGAIFRVRFPYLEFRRERERQREREREKERERERDSPADAIRSTRQCDYHACALMLRVCCAICVRARVCVWNIFLCSHIRAYARNNFPPLSLIDRLFDALSGFSVPASPTRAWIIYFPLSVGKCT